jgi:hypothetical protein
MVRKKETPHRVCIYAALQASESARKIREKRRIPSQTTRSTKLSYAPLINRLAHQGGGNNQNEERTVELLLADWPKILPAARQTTDPRPAPPKPPHSSISSTSSATSRRATSGASATFGIPTHTRVPIVSVRNLAEGSRRQARCRLSCAARSLGD